MTSAPGRRSLENARESLTVSLLSGQCRAVERVLEQAAALERIAARVAEALSSGGRLVYVGAGASGLLAMQDGLELPGTFSLDPQRIRFVTPNGQRFLIDSSGEDDEDSAAHEIDALGLGAADIVLAVSASGATPFSLAAARRAKASGASVAAIVCRLSSPLAALADVSAAFDVGVEAIEGSTRLAAGTAQKAALSVISTLACAELGLVHDGLMINVRPQNAKLRERARSIVVRVAQVGEIEAIEALEAASGDVATAIIIAAGGLDPAAASRLLYECGGNVATVLARLDAEDPQTRQARA